MSGEGRKWREPGAVAVERREIASRASPNQGRPCWTPESEDRQGLGSREGWGFGRGGGPASLQAEEAPLSASLDTWVLFPNYCLLEQGVGVA